MIESILVSNSALPGKSERSRNYSGYSSQKLTRSTMIQIILKLYASLQLPLH